ncbi:MAG: ABC transporter substrate-binding protein [Cyanobacteria bacterium P01_F01_bin.150]
MIQSPASTPGLSVAPFENITVVLRINSGSFAAGFEVTLQILDNGQIIQEDDRFLELPAEPTIPKLYAQWQSLSQEQSMDFQRAIDRGIKPVAVQVTNVEDWSQLTDQLAHQCRQWFKSASFVNLSARIRANRKVHMDGSIPIIIRSQTGILEQDQILSQLPWHLWWDLFSNLPNAEFAMFSGFREKSPALQFPIRILAIFGSPSGNLNFTQEVRALELLKQRGASLKQLVEPTIDALSDRLFEQPWDILFFAGHSSCHGESGTIQLNEQTNLRLDELRQGLRYAVNQGLRLAIFNSCDGVKLANFLANEVNIPSSIVMRQPVPDQIAGKFLLDFLQEFSKGTPLYRSVRLARGRLEGLQRNFPGASWLPTIFVNPNQPELIWPSATEDVALIESGAASTAFGQAQKEPQPPKRGGQKKAIALPILIGLGLVGLVTALLMGRAFRRPPEKPLTVEVDSFISQGENSLEDTRIALAPSYLGMKQRGIDAFRAGDYATAFLLFDELRNQAKQEKNAADPSIAKPALAALQDYESLIYRNNALILRQKQQNPDLPTYNVAVAAPLNFDAGTGLAYGVAQAQDVFVNQQGLNLLVTLANDGNQEVRTQAIAQDLASTDDILAVVGHYTSPNSCVALQSYSPQRLVMMSPTSTAIALQSDPTCGDINNVFFRTVSSTRFEAQTLVNYLIDDLAIAQPNLAVFYNYNELFSRNLAEQFQEVVRAFEGSVTTYDLSDPEFKPNRLPTVAESADALVILPDGGTNDTAAFDQAINILKLNQGEKPVLGSNTFYLQTVLNQVEADALVDRLFMADDWHPQQCGAEQFSQQTREYWGGDLNRRTALAYDAVQAIAQAITLAAEENGTPTKTVTRQQVRQKLAETGIRPETAARSATSADMIISFDENGDRKEITTRQIVTVAESNNQLRFELVDQGDCPSP